MGHAARANAKRRAAGMVAPNLYPHITLEEQAAFRQQAQRVAKRMRGVPGRHKRQYAEDLFRGAMAEREQQLVAQAQKVKPVTGGLVVPRASLLVTPEEVRRMART